MFTEDLTAFFNADEHAVAATYKAGGNGSGVTVNVIFDRAVLDQLGVYGTNPMAMARASDLSGWTSADTLTINGTVYRLYTQPQPQDDGALVLCPLQVV